MLGIPGNTQESLQLRPCFIDGGPDDSSLKKRGRKDKGEKPRKGGHGSRKGPSPGKPQHGKVKKQKRSDDGKKGKGRGKDRSGSSVVMNPGDLKNQDALPSSNTSKPVQNVLRYDGAFSIYLFLLVVKMVAFYV